MIAMSRMFNMKDKNVGVKLKLHFNNCVRACVRPSVRPYARVRVLMFILTFARVCVLTIFEYTNKNKKHRLGKQKRIVDCRYVF